MLAHVMVRRRNDWISYDDGCVYSPEPVDRHMVCVFKAFTTDLSDEATAKPELRRGAGSAVTPAVTPALPGLGRFPLSLRYCWCRVRGLNSRPTVYKTAALPLS